MHACLNSILTKLFQTKLLYEICMKLLLMHNKCMGLYTETYSAVDDNQHDELTRKQE